MPLKTAWERIKEGDGLKPTAKPKVDDQIALYERVMATSHPDLRETGAKFVVRQWDGMDGCWCDCTGAVGATHALKVWLERTEGGTKRVSFSQIDYYKIFPADTKMLYDGDNEMFR